MVNSGKGEVSFELDMLLICHDMGWDYYTFVAQPSWFIEGIRTIRNIDAKRQNALMKKHGRK